MPEIFDAQEKTKPSSKAAGKPAKHVVEMNNAYDIEMGECAVRIKAVDNDQNTNDWIFRVKLDEKTTIAVFMGLLDFIGFYHPRERRRSILVGDTTDEIYRRIKNDRPDTVTADDCKNAIRTLKKVHGSIKSISWRSGR